MVLAIAGCASPPPVPGPTAPASVPVAAGSPAGIAVAWAKAVFAGERSDESTLTCPQASGGNVTSMKLINAEVTDVYAGTVTGGGDSYGVTLEVAGVGGVQEFSVHVARINGTFLVCYHGSPELLGAATCRCCGRRSGGEPAARFVPVSSVTSPARGPGRSADSAELQPADHTVPVAAPVRAADRKGTLSGVGYPGRRSSTGTATSAPTAGRDTWSVTMATTTLVERSGPGISAALDKHAPQERRRFEAELRDALARASEDLDEARIDEVLSRWHSRATIVANPLTSEEQAVMRRVRAGQLTGLRARDEHGGWTTL
jgi:Family of unknown function (DUF6247)